MLPVDVTADGVRGFVLTSSIDSCHWGLIGLPNEWVLVDMADDRRVPFLKLQAGDGVRAPKRGAEVARRVPGRPVPLARRVHRR